MPVCISPFGEVMLYLAWVVCFPQTKCDVPLKISNVFSNPFFSVHRMDVIDALNMIDDPAALDEIFEGVDIVDVPVRREFEEIDNPLVVLTEDEFKKR